MIEVYEPRTRAPAVSEHGLLPGLRARPSSYMDRFNAKCNHCKKPQPHGALWVAVPDEVADGLIKLPREIARACQRLNQSGVTWCLPCARGLGRSIGHGTLWVIALFASALFVFILRALIWFG